MGDCFEALALPAAQRNEDERVAARAGAMILADIAQEVRQLRRLWTPKKE